MTFLRVVNVVNGWLAASIVLRGREATGKELILISFVSESEIILGHGPS